MSSDYHVLCASHDPALVITFGGEYRSYAEALAAAADPAQDDRLVAHVGCDLLVGRYSTPLIEVACPGGERCKPGWHRFDSGERTSAGWLRLLHAAHVRGDDVTSMRLPACWTRERVLRLAVQLGIKPEEAKP